MEIVDSRSRCPNESNIIIQSFNMIHIEETHMGMCTLLHVEGI